MNQPINEDIWQQRVKWSTAANLQKSTIDRWRNIVLILAISGAILATLSTQLSAGFFNKLSAWLSVALLAVIPIITTRKLSAQQTRTWTRLRSVSEALKSEIFTYLAQAAPYDGPAKNPGKILRDNIKKFENRAEDLASLLLITTPSSTLPNFESPKDYIKLRLTDQIDWYENKARIYIRKVEKLRKFEFGLVVTAALLAATSAAGFGSLSISCQSINLGVWVAVMTTIGGTLSAHIAASRYDHLVTNYSATAFQLNHFVQDRSVSDNDVIPSPEWSNFVRKCEDVFSKENESWMAKWIKP